MNHIDALAKEVIRQAEGSHASPGRPGWMFGGGGGGAKWRAGLAASGRSIYINHREARQNVRVAMQDSSLARAMVERNADTVVDTGLRLELTPDFNILGISREEAEAWAADVESRFHLYASDKKQHREGTLTFYQFQRMYQFWMQRDNDTFTRLYYDRTSDLQNPLQFGSVDPDQIAGDSITSTYGFQGGQDGIKRDPRGREVSYRVWVKKENGTYKDTVIPAKAAGGRPYMLHGFRPEYAGQGRGFPRLAHAIQEFENITDFSASTIKKAINQSQIVGVVEPAADEDASNPFEDIMTDQGAGPAADMFGSNPTTAPESADLQPGVNACYELPEATSDIPGSMFITNLTKGAKIKFLQNSAPGDSFDKFVDAFAGYLSAATSTPLEVVLMKFGNNYSASRATLLLFWRVANGWRAEQDADMMSPVVETWLSEEIGAGRVTAPGWSDPRLKAAWMNHNWIGTPAPDIDPSKTAKARQLNIEMGITSTEREAKDLNGSSAAANIEKNNKLFAEMEAAPWGKNAQPGQAPAGNGSVQGMLEDILDVLEGMGDG